MNEVERIGNLLEQTYNGKAWHGSSLRTLLADVTADEAAARPLPGAHTIWQEVLHIIAWREVACGLLEGRTAGELAEEKNWPAVGDGGESAWRQTLDRLEESQHRLRALLRAFPDERLNVRAPGLSLSFYEVIHGVIHHDVYHAGQIAVLRNAQRQPR